MIDGRSPKFGFWPFFDPKNWSVTARAISRYEYCTSIHVHLRNIVSSPWTTRWRLGAFFQIWSKLEFLHFFKKRSKAPSGDPWWLHYIYEKHIHWRTICMPRNSPCCHWSILMTKKWSIFNFSPVSIKSLFFKNDSIYDVIGLTASWTHHELALQLLIWLLTHTSHVMVR